MQRGNPYHDERGRFTSPYGACQPSSTRVWNLALDSAESWQEEHSNIQPDGYDNKYPFLRDGSGGYSDFDEAMDEERVEVAERYEGEILSIYQAYNEGICAKVKTMDYETLKDFAEHPERYDKDVREAAAERGDVYEAELIADCASEDFYDSDTDVVDLRYRRIVAKCNGNHKLFEMAMDEDDKYGLNGYAKNYATQKIKAKGLEEEYTYYQMAKGAYERGEQALAKSPNEYKDMKSYIIAKVKYYKHVDEK